jgi:hypothetical protein
MRLWMCYNGLAREGRDAGLLFVGAYTPSQSRFVDRAPVIAVSPRAVFPGSVGNRCDGGFVMALTAAERFWSKVDKSAGPDGCWPWIGARFKRTGYGQFGYQGRPQAAHRVGKILAGEPPLGPGLDACHTCDNRLCCNPAHTFWGTRLENVQDMVRKGRNSRGPEHGQATLPERRARGERHPQSKLSTAQVTEIRKASGSHRQIARIYGVSYRLVGMIRRHERWAHIA